MKLRNGLALFERTNSPGHWNVASFHSPHSMTWRWILAFSFFRGDEARVRPLWWGHQTNQGPRWGVRLPFVGMLTWQQQHPMWYRDFYQRLRDEKDEQEGRFWRGPAYVPPPEVPNLPPSSTSVH